MSPRKQAEFYQKVALQNLIAAGNNYGRMLVEHEEKGVVSETGRIMANVNLKMAAVAHYRASCKVTEAILDQCQNSKNA